MQVKADHLSFSYEDHVDIFNDVHFCIDSNEFIGIIGPNGGGKTTLLNLLMGFIKPTKGEITVKGKIGYVPQVSLTDRDFPITTRELIYLGALSKANFLGKLPESIQERGAFLIKKLGLQNHQHKIFGSLSGGLAQRAYLARALLSDPDLLLLDEPTANIDPESKQIIFEILGKLKGNKTILLVTHDLETATKHVDRILIVQNEINSVFPQDLCKHFAFGLYHTPLRRNNLKNRESGKKDPQNFRSEQETIAEWQGSSENENSKANLTQPTADSSNCFGIIQKSKTAHAQLAHQ